MSKPYLLVVDDEQTILDLMKLYFEDCGYRVLSTADPLEALEILGREQVDIVLSDINMPGIDGIELLKRMKAEHPLLQFIMLTAYSSIDKIQDCLQAGASDYLIKPVEDMEVLENIIKEADRRIKRWKRNFIATMKKKPRK